MLGTRQKECLIKGSRRSIHLIKSNIITNPDDIVHIVETIMELARQKIISDYSEVGTSARELWFLMPGPDSRTEG